MSRGILHITNGYALTNNMVKFGYTEEILTWQEMLCEGPTIAKIDSSEFFDIRAKFLKESYDIEVNHEELAMELALLDNANEFNEIILWFEYDLFCHINLIGVINLLHQKEITTPLSLVCSGRVKGKKELMGLGQLNKNELKNHYDNRQKLTQDNIDLMIALWRTYNGSDHNIFKMYITQKTPFKYLSNCLKAHLKRFPNTNSGLSVLEETVLKIIDTYKVTSINQLLGLCLNHQGYYGYGDLQFKRMIDKLAHFYEKTADGFVLTHSGKKALEGKENYAHLVNNNLKFGGVQRLDHHFSILENKLVTL